MCLRGVRFEIMAVLYIMNINDLMEERYYNRYLSFVPEEKRRRISEFHFPADRARSLGASLLSRIAAREAGLPETCHVAEGARGKPYIIEEKNFHYNISHSGAYAIFGVSKREIGVDIEKIGEFRKKVMERFFSVSEREYITSSPDPVSAFYRIWTLRESYMKMLGEGLSLEQKSFSIEIGREIRVSGESVRGPASFSETEELEGYRLAVCEDGIAAELKLIFRSPEDL